MKLALKFLLLGLFIWFCFFVHFPVYISQSEQLYSNFFSLIVHSPFKLILFVLFMIMVTILPFFELFSVEENQKFNMISTRVISISYLLLLYFPLNISIQYQSWFGVFLLTLMGISVIVLFLLTLRNFTFRINKSIILLTSLIVLITCALLYRNSKLQIDSSYDSLVVSTREDLIIILDGNKYGLISKNGDVLLEPKYEYISYTENGYFITQYNDLIGILDSNGHQLIENKYYTIGEIVTLKDDRDAIVVKEDKGFYAIVDFNGETIFNTNQSGVISGIYDDYAVVIDDEFLSIYHIFSGERLVTTLPFLEITSYNEGVFILYDGFKQLYGFIDIESQTVVEPKYQSLKFSEGLGLARKDRYYGYVNEKDEIVIDFIYKNAYPFSEGLAAVTNMDEAAGYIDKSGDEAIPFQYQYTYPFVNGVGRVFSLNSYCSGSCFINTEGNTIEPIMNKDFPNQKNPEMSESTYYPIENQEYLLVEGNNIYLISNKGEVFYQTVERYYGYQLTNDGPQLGVVTKENKRILNNEYLDITFLSNNLICGYKLRQDIDCFLGSGKEILKNETIQNVTDNQNNTYTIETVTDAYIYDTQGKLIERNLNKFTPVSYAKGYILITKPDKIILIDLESLEHKVIYQKNEIK